MEEGLLAQGGMGEERGWVGRRHGAGMGRGMLEVLALFGAAVVMVGVLVVCFRMGVGGRAGVGEERGTNVEIEIGMRG